MKSDFNNLFYNLVPGGFFAYIWYEILKNKIVIVNIWDLNFMQYDASALTAFLIISFIIGFLLHSFWSIGKMFIPFERCLFFYNNKNIENNFHKQNRELNSQNQIRFAEFFSDRSAYWGNFGLGFLITLLLYLYCYYDQCVDSKAILFLLISVIFSFYSYYHYRKKEINTVWSKY